MDPNNALTRIRELIKEDGRSELSCIVEGLDRWISTGGLIPNAWREKDPVFPQLRAALRATKGSRVPLRKEQEQKQ